MRFQLQYFIKVGVDANTRRLIIMIAIKRTQKCPSGQSGGP